MINAYMDENCEKMLLEITANVMLMTLLTMASGGGRKGVEN